MRAIWKHRKAIGFVLLGLIGLAVGISAETFRAGLLAIVFGMLLIVSPFRNFVVARLEQWGRRRASNSADG